MIKFETHEGKESGVPMIERLHEIPSYVANVSTVTLA